MTDRGRVAVLSGSGIRLGDDPAVRSAPVVYVVDDDISVREALEALFSSAGWRTELFSSAKAFLSHHRDTGPSCLVLDLSLPDIYGLDLQMRISADTALMPVVVITAYGDVPQAVRAMKAGAHEFLIKPLDDECLLNAVRQAIERSRAALNEEAENRLLRARLASLSRREREVMSLITRGLLNKQVGAELGISEITVKAHRGRVMRKMQARSLVDLVNMGAKLDLRPADRAGQDLQVRP
jgi:FixJ family two-component response regulator